MNTHIIYIDRYKKQQLQNKKQADRAEPDTRIISSLHLEGHIIQAIETLNRLESTMKYLLAQTTKANM